MSWDYDSHEALEADGYEVLDESRCRGTGCGEMIQWVKTPNGKLMPLNADDLQPHHATCKAVKEFRR